jgi:hypothetical protein
MFCMSLISETQFFTYGLRSVHCGFTAHRGFQECEPGYINCVLYYYFYAQCELKSKGGMVTGL